jgi:hypothetical protein
MTEIPLRYNWFGTGGHQLGWMLQSSFSIFWNKYSFVWWCVNDHSSHMQINFCLASAIILNSRNLVPVEVTTNFKDVGFFKNKRYKQMWSKATAIMEVWYVQEIPKILNHWLQDTLSLKYILLTLHHVYLYFIVHMRQELLPDPR